MKHILITIAAVVLVGCGESQQSVPPAEAKPVEPVAEAATPEPPTAKAPNISIHKAANSGNIEAVKQHLTAGTDVNAKEKFTGYSPLIYAASKGHKEIVKLLITKGADVNAKDKLVSSPLHYAARYGHRELVELLIANGADVNAKDDNFGTPLHRAAVYGSKEVAELLIAKGADVNAKDDYGETPLDTAIWTNFNPFGSAEIADLLRKHGGKAGSEKHHISTFQFPV